MQQLTTTAKTVSGTRLECNSVQHKFDKHFKTRSFHMITNASPILELDKPPLGRCRIHKQCINCWKFCFRTLRSKYYNTNPLIYYCFPFFFTSTVHFLQHYFIWKDIYVTARPVQIDSDSQINSDSIP